MGSCGVNTSAGVAQAPRNLSFTSASPKIVFDWNLYYFAFTPKYYASQIQVEGEKNYVYQITLKDNTTMKGF